MDYSLDSIRKKLESGSDAPAAQSQLIVLWFLSLMHEIGGTYSKIILSKTIYKVARMLTWPYHHLWIIGWKVGKWLFNPKKIFFDEPGFQVISANTGGGKTSLMYELIERRRHLYKKNSYINTPFEKPRIDREKGVKYRYHRVYKFEDFWSNGKTHKIPNDDKFDVFTIDEIHRILNYRQNGTREYSEKFIPFSEYAVVSRHHIGRIWATTQMDKVDVQLMQITKYFHEVRIDIGFDYPDWLLQTGLFKLNIIGWYIDTYTVDTTSVGTLKSLVKSWYLKNEYADFAYYNTFSMSGTYVHLKKDF